MEYNVFIDAAHVILAFMGLIAGAVFVSDIKKELALNADGLKKDMKKDMTELKEDMKTLKNQLTELQIKTEV